MANKKVIAAIAFASMAAIGLGVGAGVGISQQLNPTVANNHMVSWTSAPTLEEGKLIMRGDENGAIEVKATNDAVNPNGVVTLNANGTFENVSAIGRIIDVTLTYTVGDSKVEHNGDADGKVLKAEFGYAINSNDSTVVFGEPVVFANNWHFNSKEPSFIRFTSTTDKAINISKVDLTYVCTSHAYSDALAIDGLYVVGKGSFVKNNAEWSAYGGSVLTHTGDQNEIVMDFKKGDIFGFRNTYGVDYGFNFSADSNSAFYKEIKPSEGVAVGRIEILQDCKLGIYLKDGMNGNLYLAVK